MVHNEQDHSKKEGAMFNRLIILYKKPNMSLVDLKKRLNSESCSLFQGCNFVTYWIRFCCR